MALHDLSIRVLRAGRRLRASGPGMWLLAAALVYAALPVVHAWSHDHGGGAVAGAIGADDCGHEDPAGHRHGGDEPSAPEDDRDCPICVVLAFGRAATLGEGASVAPAAVVAGPSRAVERGPAVPSFALEDAPARAPPRESPVC